MSEADKPQTLGQLIMRRFHTEAMRNPGKWKSLADMAKKLGFKQSTFSTWCSDSKIPTDTATIDKLAAAFGVEVYDILGVARRMPNDRRLNLIATVWHMLPEQVQDEWYETSQNYAEDGDDGRKRKATS